MQDPRPFISKTTQAHDADSTKYHTTHSISFHPSSSALISIGVVHDDVSSAIRSSMSGTARSWSSISSLSLRRVSFYLPLIGLKMYNLLFKLQPPLRIQFRKDIISLSIKLQNHLMILPQAPPMTDGHKRDA